MDSGDIIHQAAIDVADDEHIGSVLVCLENHIVDEFSKLWTKVIEGTATHMPQEHSQSTFCGQRLTGDGRIDWNKSADEVHNFIRAQSTPYPGAFTVLEGQGKITCISGRRFAGYYYGTPGQVLKVGKDGATIACGSGTAYILATVMESGIVRPISDVFTTIGIRS